MILTDYEYEKYEKLRGYKRKWTLTNNEYRVEGNTVYVTLKYKNETSTMICDLEDWERLKDYLWVKIKSGGYAGTNATIDKKHTIIKFHQLVMGQKKGFIIDHINRNPLDNRKENLRFVTPTGNMLNRTLSANNKSGYPGVSWRKESHRWRATITLNNKQVNLGNYLVLEDAIKARKEAEEKYYKPLLEIELYELYHNRKKKSVC